MVVELIEHGLADVPIVKLPNVFKAPAILILPVVVVPQIATSIVAFAPLKLLLCILVPVKFPLQVISFVKVLFPNMLICADVVLTKLLSV